MTLMPSIDRQGLVAFGRGNFLVSWLGMPTRGTRAKLQYVCEDLLE
jgi:hypothetical protein